MNTLFRSFLDMPKLVWCMLKAMGCLCCGVHLLAVSALAQESTPGPVAPTGVTAPVALGAVILSPAQRRALEISRSARGNADVTVQAQTVHSGDARSSLPDTLAIAGIVVRSGNRSTVWINDLPLYGQGPMTSLRTLAGQAGVLQPGGHELQLKSRPGQIIDVPSGQAVDMLPPGAIRVIPPTIGTGALQKRELLP
jgi:hypothetical protein